MDDYSKNHSSARSIDSLYFYCMSSLQFCRESALELTTLSYITNLKSVLETNCSWYSSNYDLKYMEELASSCKQNHEIKDEFSAEYVAPVFQR